MIDVIWITLDLSDNHRKMCACRDDIGMHISLIELLRVEIQRFVQDFFIFLDRFFYFFGQDFRMNRIKTSGSAA
jgi:hypothetical protein